jgi:hypothetical protein
MAASFQHWMSDEAASTIRQNGGSIAISTGQIMGDGNSNPVLDYVCLQLRR